MPEEDTLEAQAARLNVNPATLSEPCFGITLSRFAEGLPKEVLRMVWEARYGMHDYCVNSEEETDTLEAIADWLEGSHVTIGIDPEEQAELRRMHDCGEHVAFVAEWRSGYSIGFTQYLTMSPEREERATVTEEGVAVMRKVRDYEWLPG